MHGFNSDIKATEINQPYSVNIIVFNVNCRIILMNHGGLTLGPFFKAKFLACRVQIFLPHPEPGSLRGLVILKLRRQTTPLMIISIGTTNVKYFCSKMFITVIGKAVKQNFLLRQL